MIPTFHMQIVKRLLSEADISSITYVQMKPISHTTI